MKQNQNTLNSEKAVFDGKVFFFDLKEARNGSKYLVITQSKPVEDEKYERIRMILFEEEIQQFNASLTEVLKDFKPQKGRPSETYINELRKTYPMAFQPWTKENEELLISMHNEGKDIPTIAKALQRQEGAIKARLNKLGLIESTLAA